MVTKIKKLAWWLVALFVSPAAAVLSEAALDWLLTKAGRIS